MKCLICENKSLVQILRKRPIRIWLNTADSVKNYHAFECRLLQCPKCGHIQQNLTSKLERFLASIYNSNQAQVSTQLGSGNWGKRRANDILTELPVDGVKSVLEIGCAGGYLLRYLRKAGFANLIGIDPSLKKTYSQDGIKYVSNYADANLNLHKKFDLVISICAFEHIKHLDAVLRFASNHLTDEGMLFFEVPNFDKAFTKGDPIVFLHEHVHYFTKSSLYYLLSENGFSISRIKRIRDSFFVYAHKKTNSNKVFTKKVILYSDYELKLEKNISAISNLALNKRIAFHGVCNTLNNILGLGRVKGNFGIFDNDSMKIGKVYFGKRVKKPSSQSIKEYESIIITPTIFFKEIKEQYKRMGFSGSILGVV